MSYRADERGVVHLSRVRRRRRDTTDAERKLWSHLRNRQLDGVKFRRQHELAGYVLDFCAPEYRLPVEADGGQHYSHGGEAHDERRSVHLANQGIQLMRFSNNDILTNIDGVLESIRARVVRPSPQPSPRGRGSEP